MIGCGLQVIDSAEHFSGFRFKLLLSHHSEKDEMSDCKLDPSAKHSIFRKILLSSANNELDEVKMSGKSLIKSKNKRGPSIDPCGTPDVGEKLSDLPPPITTHCVLPKRYDRNQCNVIDLIPKFCSLRSNNP